jgi:beta-galactosidase
MISDSDDFLKYRVVIAPLMFLMTPELETRLRNYAAAGGHLVLTMRTGVKTWTNIVVPHTLPGPLADVVGLTIHDYDCLWGVSQAVRWEDERCVTGPEPCAKWCDLITPSGARPLAYYTMDYYKETPAITENAYEKGRAYYVGTELPPTIMEAFIFHALAGAGVKPIIEAAPEGVEVTRRRGEKEDYLFILNHNRTAVDLVFPTGWKVLIGRELRKNEILHLDPYGVAVCTSE